jgi:hypothetical protein
VANHSRPYVEDGEALKPTVAERRPGALSSHSPIAVNYNGLVWPLIPMFDGSAPSSHSLLSLASHRCVQLLKPDCGRIAKGPIARSLPNPEQKKRPQPGEAEAANQNSRWRGAIPAGCSCAPSSTAESKLLR